MKRSFFVIFVALLLTLLISCNISQPQSDGGSDSESYDSKECEHSFTEKNTAKVYLKSAATCQAAASYYYSCSCGEKGDTTFTDGEPLKHSYIQKRIGEKYIRTQATTSTAATYYYSCECGKIGSEYFFYGTPSSAPSSNGSWISCDKTVYCLTGGSLYSKPDSSLICGNGTISAKLKVVATNGEWYEIDKNNILTNCTAYIKCDMVTENSSVVTFMKLPDDFPPPDAIIKDTTKGAYLYSDLSGDPSSKVGCVTSGFFSVVGLNKTKTYASVYFSGSDTNGRSYDSSKLYYCSLNELEIVGAPEEWQ